MAYLFRNKNPFGIYKIYTKNNKINLISFSPIFIQANYECYESTMINNKFGFYADKNSIINEMGDNYFSITEKIDSMTLLFDPNIPKRERIWYFTEGIYFNLENDLLQGFQIFQPLNDEIINEYKRRLNKK